MSQHTPGPWTLSAQHIEASGKRIASASWAKVRPASMTLTAEEGAANARLIAAAPTLLAALEQVNTWLVSPMTDSETLREMYQLTLAALRAAKGESA